MNWGGGIDIIIPDAFFIKDGLKIASICGIRNEENSKERILKAWEAFELSLFWDIAGFALFRACLLKKIRFLESAMNGDEYAVRACFLEANKIAFAREGAYLYHQVSTSLTKKLSPRKFNIHRVFYELEKLAIEKKLPKKLIKKINKERYNQLYNLSKEFEEKKHLLKEEEKRLIRSYLDENESLLSFYKSSFFDSIFRKQKDKFGKFVLFFSFFKIYYKR